MSSLWNSLRPRYGREIDVVKDALLRLLDEAEHGEGGDSDLKQQVEIANKVITETLNPLVTSDKDEVVKRAHQALTGNFLTAEQRELLLRIVEGYIVKEPADKLVDNSNADGQVHRPSYEDRQEVAHDTGGFKMGSFPNSVSKRVRNLIQPSFAHKYTKRLEMLVPSITKLPREYDEFRTEFLVGHGLSGISTNEEIAVIAGFTEGLWIYETELGRAQGENLSEEAMAEAMMRDGKYIAVHLFLDVATTEDQVNGILNRFPKVLKSGNYDELYEAATRHSLEWAETFASRLLRKTIDDVFGR